MFFFFFQAEDGIRDIGVTGVQTCALPILPAERTELFTAGPARWRQELASFDPGGAPWATRVQSADPVTYQAGREYAVRWGARSEERRVGKECRSRWSPYH